MGLQGVFFYYQPELVYYGCNMKTGRRKRGKTKRRGVYFLFGELAETSHQHQHHYHHHVLFFLVFFFFLPAGLQKGELRRNTGTIGGRRGNRWERRGQGNLFYHDNSFFLCFLFFRFSFLSYFFVSSCGFFPLRDVCVLAIRVSLLLLIIPLGTISRCCTWEGPGGPSASPPACILAFGHLSFIFFLSSFLLSSTCNDTSPPTQAVEKAGKQ